MTPLGLLFAAVLVMLPALGLAQLLLPSSHSPLPLPMSLSSSRLGRSCACPGQQTHSQPALTKAVVVKARAKAHHRPQQQQEDGGGAVATKLDQSLLGALRDVGHRLAPFKKSSKGVKKRKGAGRTRIRQLLHSRPRREVASVAVQGVVDPALAEGAQKCNSERIRHIIRKARGRDSAALKRNIQALAERSLAARFNVVCARGDFSYISNTEEFCQERVHGNTCYVFRQLGRPLPFPEPPQLDHFERSFTRREEAAKKRHRHRKA